MKKHIEIKTIDHKGVSVTVKIDYDKCTASLVHYDDLRKDWVTKDYFFGGRGLEYMNGWLDILEALTVAVKECKKDLEAKLAEESAFKEKIMIEVNHLKKKK